MISFVLVPSEHVNPPSRAIAADENAVHDICATCHRHNNNRHRCPIGRPQWKPRASGARSTRRQTTAGLRTSSPTISLPRARWASFGLYRQASGCVAKLSPDVASACPRRPFPATCTGICEEVLYAAVRSGRLLVPEGLRGHRCAHCWEYSLVRIVHSE